MSGYRKLWILGVTFLILSLVELSAPQKERDMLKKVRWWEIHRYFLGVASNGLLTRSLQDKLNEDFVGSEEEANLVNLLSVRQKNMDTLFNQITQAGKKIRRAIADTYHLFQDSEAKSHCCDKMKEGVTDQGCFQRKGTDHGLAANPPAKVLKTMRDILSVYPTTPLLYFSLHDGSSYFYPSVEVLSQNTTQCQDYNAHVRSWYEVTRYPMMRDVAIFMGTDDGSDSDIIRDLKSQVASQVVSSLTQNDKVTIWKADAPDGAERAKDDGWLTGTARHRQGLIAMLQHAARVPSKPVPAGLATEGDRVRAIKAVFDSLSAPSIDISRKAEKVVVQLVSGPSVPCLHSALWTSVDMLQPTVITYVIGSEIESSCSNVSSDYHVVHILSSQDLNDVNKSFMNFFKWSKYLANEEFSSYSLEDDIRIALPYSSYFSHRIILTLSLPIVIDGRFVGVVGCDISKLTNLQYVTDFGDIQDSYGFLIDLQGRALSHPLLPNPQCTKYDTGHIVCKEPTYELVNHLEQHENVQDILQSMVDMGNGSKIIEGNYIQSTGHSINNEGNSVLVKKMKLAYAWLPLTSIKLSFCIVIPVHNDKIYRTSYKCANGDKCSDPLFDYYLETNQTGAELCSYYGNNVVKNKGLIKFAATVFGNPIRYLLANDPILNAIREGESPYTLLKGTSLAASVVMAKTALVIWSKDKSLTCHIGVRFFGTSDGVLITYPGITQLSPSYDPREKSWYQVAVANQDSHPAVSLTTPNEDAFGGTATISVVAPVRKSLPSGSAMLVGVAGAEFSIKFLSQQLLSRVKECDGISVACFVIDVMGFLVLDLNDDSEGRFHLTEAYPEIAAYLTTSELLVRKGCHDYEKDTQFLYWTFKMSHGTTNFFSSNNNTSFAIYKIPYMNVFLVARLVTGEGRTKVEHSSVCLSTCSKSVEPPCTVNLFSECQHSEQDMRTSFLKMSPCFSNGANIKLNIKPRTCQVKMSENVCHNSSQNTICDLWKHKC